MGTRGFLQPSERGRMSTQMPEGQGGDVAKDLETEEQRRDREERERERTEGSQEERQPSEDDAGAGQGSAGGAV